MKRQFLAYIVPALALICSQGQAQMSTQASAPFTPTWVARHYLQWLADQQSLPVLTTQWPLPSGAVAQSLSGLSSTSAGVNSVALAFVQNELALVQGKGS